MQRDRNLTSDQKSSSPVTNDLLIDLRKKDELLRTVAHDLRNPLGGITALTDLLLTQTYDASEQAEMLDAIKEAAQHSLKLVEDLLTVETDIPRTVQPLRIHLHQVIYNCVRLSLHLLDRKGLQLELDLFEGNDEIAIDRKKLTRVLDNLLTNAVKFTPEGGRIAVATRLLSQGVQIMVKDNGVGISDAIRSKIFTGAKETQRQGTSGESSHGLGLPICKRIIENAGGTITFQSKPDKGTIFYVWLPGSHS